MVRAAEAKAFRLSFRLRVRKTCLSQVVEEQLGQLKGQYSQPPHASEVQSTGTPQRLGGQDAGAS